MWLDQKNPLMWWLCCRRIMLFLCKPSFVHSVVFTQKYCFQCSFCWNWYYTTIFFYKKMNKLHLKNSHLWNIDIRFFISICWKPHLNQEQINKLDLTVCVHTYIHTYVCVCVCILVSVQWTLFSLYKTKTHTHMCVCVCVYLGLSTVKTMFTEAENQIANICDF